MALSPVEIRHLQLGRSLRGYSTATVDRLLTEIADAFEDVWRERADLADRVEQLETDLAKHRETEGLLRATLVSAERSSRELKEQAHRRAAGGGRGAARGGGGGAPRPRPRGRGGERRGRRAAGRNPVAPPRGRRR